MAFWNYYIKFPNGATYTGITTSANPSHRIKQHGYNIARVAEDNPAKHEAAMHMRETGQEWEVTLIEAKSAVDMLVRELFTIESDKYHTDMNVNGNGVMSNSTKDKETGDLWGARLTEDTLTIRRSLGTHTVEDLFSIKRS